MNQLPSENSAKKWGVETLRGTQTSLDLGYCHFVLGGGGQQGQAPGHWAEDLVRELGPRLARAVTVAKLPLDREWKVSVHGLKVTQYWADLSPATGCWPGCCCWSGGRPGRWSWCRSRSRGVPQPPGSHASDCHRRVRTRWTGGWPGQRKGMSIAITCVVTMRPWDGDSPRSAGSGQAGGGRGTPGHCCGRGRAPRLPSWRRGAGNMEAESPSRGQRPEAGAHWCQEQGHTTQTRDWLRPPQDWGENPGCGPGRCWSRAGQGSSCTLITLMTAGGWNGPIRARHTQLAAMSAPGSAWSSQHLSRLRVHLPSLAIGKSWLAYFL